MDYPLLSPEIPGEFDGVSPDLVALIRHSRSEKAQLRQLERMRAMAAAERSDDHVLDTLDERIRSLDVSRVKLLHGIAGLVPGYNIALGFAVETLGFDEASGTVRYCKRRKGCFTFGMPRQSIISVWVDVPNGKVERAEPIDW